MESELQAPDTDRYETGGDEIEFADESDESDDIEVREETSCDFYHGYDDESDEITTTNPKHWSTLVPDLFDR